MLTELCGELRNWFIKDEVCDKHRGRFVISGGRIENLPFLQEDQYYRIVGSVFNDGVWMYGEKDNRMHDEVFCGEVWAMCVPIDFIELCSEIEDWLGSNAQALNSPYASESFGGYSYSLKTGRSNYGDNGSAELSWKSQFASKLARWRKL